MCYVTELDNLVHFYGYFESRLLIWDQNFLLVAVVGLFCSLVCFKIFLFWLFHGNGAVRAHFEFMDKLGVNRWCFHDRDIAPDAKTLLVYACFFSFLNFCNLQWSLNYTFIWLPFYICYNTMAGNKCKLGWSCWASKGTSGHLLFTS